LDEKTIIHREHFDCEIIAMNITESHLLVYTSDYVIRYFSIHLLPQQKLEFRMHQALSLSEFMGTLNKSAVVKCIARYPPSNAPTVRTMSQNPILVLKNGQLFRISKGDNGWDAIKVADRVEHFWVSNHRDDVMQLQSSIWVFDGTGAKVLVILIKDCSSFCNVSESACRCCVPNED
jgi:hypothetical protein